MVPELLLALSVSRTDLPVIRSPLQALLESCELEQSGDAEGALLRLKAANDAAEIKPGTSIPPVY